MAKETTRKPKPSAKMGMTKIDPKSPKAPQPPKKPPGSKGKAKKAM